MKKVDRINKAKFRKAQSETYGEKVTAMREFISRCRDSMTAEEWDTHFPEAEQSAGETFHIVEYLMDALGKCQTVITPTLLRSIDTMMKELEIAPSEWTEFTNLNLDSYWQDHYGIR